VIAHLPRETRALVDQSAADAEPARTRLDEQHPQLRHPLAFRMLHEHHRADVLAILLSDPAALTLWIEVADEVRDDLRDERLEALVPAVLAVVEHTVAVHDPTHVARPVRTQDVRHAPLGPRAKQLFDRAHRLDEPFLLLRAQPFQKRLDLIARRAVDDSERLLPGGREREQLLPAVRLRLPLLDEPPLL